MPDGSKTIQFPGLALRRRGWAVMLVMVVLAAMPCFSRAGADVQRQAAIPFTPGERLCYTLLWTFVPAGEAVLEVLPMEIVNGEPAYHFRLTVQSNSFVDLFYKVRDRIDGFVDQKITHSVRYLKKQREGRTRREVAVAFDWPAGLALYKDKKKSGSIPVPPGAFDPLSIFYYSRTLAFAEDDVLERAITDGTRSITGRARIIRREQISVPSGTYNTFLLEPEMEHVGGVFEKEKGAKIKLWVTADHRRIPVRIASKVSVGSFVGELSAIE